VALGGDTTVSVTVQTQVTSASLRQHKSLLWLAFLLPAGLLLRRRHAAALLLLTLLAGCGSSRTIPSTGGSGSTGPLTPSGTYTITASATSAGLTRTVNLTLTVE
jgi:hypothetical protein